MGNRKFRINMVFVLSGLKLEKKVRAFFPQGQSKLSVIPSVASKSGHETKKHILIGCQT